ncbi:MAG TPA: hypothetical protein PLG75_06385 [Methanoculleus sp.]|nr:hypothetical protein [Methanoculleus sp.]
MDKSGKNAHLFLAGPDIRYLEGSIRASYAYQMQSAVLLVRKTPETCNDSFLDEVRGLFGVGLDLRVEWIAEEGVMEIAKRITDAALEQRRAGNTVLINICDNDPFLVIPGYITACLTGSTIILTGAATEQRGEGGPESMQIPLVPVCKPLKTRLSILAAIQDGVNSQDELIERVEFKSRREAPEAPYAESSSRMSRSGMSHHVKILEKKGLIQTAKGKDKAKRIMLTDMGRLMYDVYGEQP